MASSAVAAARPVRVSLAVSPFDRVLAALALALLGIVLLALARGVAEWSRVAPMVWAHLATVLVALALTPVMLLGRRGTQRHRRLGWLWASAMFLTAFASLFVTQTHPGYFSVIHILSVWTLIQVPVIIWSARRRDLRTHQRAVRGMVVGALLIAGVFTLPFGRMLGHWLFA